MKRYEIFTHKIENHRVKMRTNFYAKWFVRLGAKSVREFMTSARIFLFFSFLSQSKCVVSFGMQDMLGKKM